MNWLNVLYGALLTLVEMAAAFFAIKMLRKRYDFPAALAIAGFVSIVLAHVLLLKAQP